MRQKSLCLCAEGCLKVNNSYYWLESNTALKLQVFDVSTELFVSPILQYFPIQLDNFGIQISLWLLAILNSITLVPEQIFDNIML